MMYKYHQQFQVMRINLMISWFFFSVLTLLHFGFYKAPENEDYSCVFATVKFTRQNRRKTHFRCKTLQRHTYCRTQAGSDKNIFCQGIQKQRNVILLHVMKTLSVRRLMRFFFLNSSSLFIDEELYIQVLHVLTTVVSSSTITLEPNMESSDTSRERKKNPKWTY